MKSARKLRIAIDLVPIRPGKGGTGSGIWTYARELVQHLDAAEGYNLDTIYVLMNREQSAFLSHFERLHPIVFPNYGRVSLIRLIWVHLILPLWCAGRGIVVLHKLATETPWLCPACRVTTVHDFYHEFVTEQAGCPLSSAARYFAAITRRAFECSETIITVSEAIRDEARARFPDARAEIRVIPNGVLPPVSPVAAACSSANRYTVFVIAKFMPYKGQLQAVSAFEQLNDPEARLVLHGFVNDLGFVAELDQRIANSTLRHAIERRDYAASADLDALYAEVDVLLFLSQYEGFGLPVIEAQARGIPVVCSDIPVLREVGGDGAVYVDRNNAGMVAAAIRRCRSDKPFRNDLIAKGHLNAAKYTWERTARETLAVYDRMS
jgi:glycosyltransferase involved in cell wall biosynthesis